LAAIQFPRSLIFLALASLPLLLAGKCRDDNPLDPVEEEEEFTTNITLSMSSEETVCIHLFAPGETFPCCQICPPGFTRQTVVTLKRGSSVTFRAGRNGQILDSQSCRVTGEEGDVFSVRWIGAGLVCGFGFGG
jgi:hypothetical protein